MTLSQSLCNNKAWALLLIRYKQFIYGTQPWNVMLLLDVSYNVHYLSKFWGWYYFILKEMNTFTLHGCIKLINSDSKHCLLTKNPEIYIYIAFWQILSSTIVFNIDNNKKNITVSHLIVLLLCDCELLCGKWWKQGCSVSFLWTFYNTFTGGVILEQQ